MSDWQVGDLAVCVDAGPPRLPLAPSGRELIKALQLGRAYRVVDIRLSWHPLDNGNPCLRLAGFEYRTPDGEYAGHSAGRFRKVTPDKHEACEDEFVTLLKRGKVSA